VIRFVASDDAKFKTITFARGMNIVLADVTKSSTDHDSRNGSGKSSLVRTFHFLLGGNAAKGSFFRKPELAKSSFALGLELDGTDVTIVRSGRDANTHLYSEEDGILRSDAFPELTEEGKAPEGWEKISLAQWKERLARAFFGLKSDLPKYSPSMRSLLAYLVRREEGGGFGQPFKHQYIQQAWDSQVALSFLLDLDWRIPAAFEQVRDDQKSIDSLKKAARDGSFGVDIGSAAELRTEAAVARQRATDLRAQASEFSVVDQYSNFESEADRLTRRLRDLRDSDAVDRDLLTDIVEAADSEVPPGAAELERLWEQVNVVLPDHIRSTYEEVKEFHESVIANRQLYLSREADLARTRLAERHAERERLDGRRAELMQLLSSGGALEQFMALEAEVARAEGDVRELQGRYELAENLESSKAKAEGRRRELLLQLQGDHHDRSERLDRAIVLFEQYSQTLYDERRGSLVVHETLKGPEFEVEIAGKGSVGIDSMQILCFDLMLMSLLADRRSGPGFLVHDSHIFDGVDERQVAAAVELGAQLAGDLNFQYIVTMNSDAVPNFPKGFDFSALVNEVRLTDAAEDGGLFGFRFD